MARDIVARQLVFWGQVATAQATFDQQNGPGAMTVANGGAGLSTITLAATATSAFAVPINRRSVMATVRNANNANHAEATYNEAGSAANTLLVNTFTAASAAAPAATNLGYIIEIARIEFAIGPNQG